MPEHIRIIETNVELNYISTMSRWPAVFFWQAATNKIKAMIESGRPYVTSRERASELVCGAG